MARGKLRRLATITPEDELPEDKAAGRPRLFATGYGHMEKIGGVGRDAIRKTIARGVPIHRSPALMIAWGLARRGGVGPTRAAEETLRVYGLASRYIVRHRTLVYVGPTRTVPSWDALP